MSRPAPDFHMLFNDCDELTLQGNFHLYFDDDGKRWFLCLGDRIHYTGRAAQFSLALEAALSHLRRMGVSDSTKIPQASHRYRYWKMPASV